jgi:hypothetical protein
MTVQIDIGALSDGTSAMIDLEELLATRLLVQGNSGSGKSHLLRRLLEQSAPWVQQVVVDPEGDFVSLADRFGHIVVDGDRSDEDLYRIAGRVRQHRTSAVLNLERCDIDSQMRAAAAFLNGLFDAERDLWYPILVVVDEAQLFAPAAAGDVSEEARKATLGAMANLMSRGRKRGLAGVIATQRLAKLAKNVAAEASNFLMGRTFLDIDMARAADLLGLERRQAEMFRDLGRGRFVALGPALSRRPIEIRIGAVETGARSTSPKLLPMPETPPEDVHELIFKAAESEPPMPRPTRPPPQPQQSTAELLAQLIRSRPDTAPAAEEEPDAMTQAERDAAIDAVLRDLVAAEDSAFRPIAVLYQDFLVRCRIQRVGSRSAPALDLAGFRGRLAVARAGVDTDTAESPAWQHATGLARELPEDMQGIFLLLVKAAMAGAPCPSDATIARAYGTQSVGRTRRLLSYMEQRNFIVCRTAGRGGHRIVALPDLGLETAPGDPNAREEAPAKIVVDRDAAAAGEDRATADEAEAVPPLS